MNFIRACAKGAELAHKFSHFDDWTLFRRKRQDVLIEAVKRSAHSHRIQLDFGGTGTEGAQPALAGKVGALYPPIMGFLIRSDCAN